MSIYEPPGTDVPDHVLAAQERAALADTAPPERTLTAVPDAIQLYDPRAEAALLGAALIATAARDQLALLGADAFFTPKYKHVAAAIITLHEAGEAADAVTVYSHLDRHAHAQLGCPNGPGELIELQSATPATTSAPRYAQIIRNHATLRDMQLYGAEIAAAASNPGATPTDLASRAQTLLDQLHDKASAATSRLHQVPDLLDDYINSLELRSETPLVGVTTGLVDLDAAIGGLQKGRLYTLAGRPGMGKSDIGLAIARNAADAGHHTHVASIEMGHQEVLDRWIARGSRIPATNISNGHLGEQAWPHVSKAIADLAAVPLSINDDPTTAMGTIRSDVRKTGAELVVIDYIQIVDTARAESRQIEVTVLARALKRLARDLDVPVIALAQLNRGPEGRFDKRPQLADLRESGAIEQESDVVIGLYRDEQYHDDTKDRGVLELILLKNRTGPMKTVKVAYVPDKKIIANIAGAN